MIFFGIFLCFLSTFLLYSRFKLTVFGKKAHGTIIGFTNRAKGIEWVGDVDSYNYKVEYEYDGKEYTATSLESVVVPRNGIPRRNLKGNITVCFNDKKPEFVTILELKGTVILGSSLFVCGIILIIISFL